MAKAKKEASFDVLNAQGAYVRTYSVEVHGETAEELANTYAGKISGKVVPSTPAENTQDE